MIEVTPRIINERPDGTVDILFFGESPGDEEAKQGTAFVGPCGRVMDRLMASELPDKAVALDNVCPRYLGRNGVTRKPNKPDAKIRDEYLKYRADAIKQFKPKVIVCLGEHALRGLKLKGKPVANVGKISEFEGIPVVYSIHPSYCLRQPKEFYLYRRVFKSIRICLEKKKKTKFSIITDVRELEKFLDWSQNKLCAFDIETTSLHPDEGRILCCSITCEKQTRVIGLYHKELWGRCSAHFLAQVRYWWGCGPRVVHHCKFELKWMRSFESCDNDPPELFDTMLQAWCINENEPKSLDFQVVQTLGKKPYWDLIPAKGPAMADVPFDVIAEYNANDTICTMELHKLQQKRLGEAQKELLRELWIPLAGTLLNMEKRGIFIDLPVMKKLATKFKAKATRLMKQNEKNFPGINPSSPKQMQHLLFKQLGLKPVKMTPKNKPSADSDSIELLSKQEPRLIPLAEARKATSLVARCLEPWQAFAAKDNCIHPEFGLGQTTTSRLTCSNPNLQNVDRTGPQRDAMISRFKGGMIIQADYSQHELRTVAALSGCKKMLDIFKDPKVDVHQATADDLTRRGMPCTRTKAKNINFSVTYDITPYGLEKRYGIPKKEGKKLIQTWNQTYPEIAEYYDLIDIHLARFGWIENCFGHRRHLKNPDDPREKRQSHNAPVQGAAFTVCALALVEIDLLIRERRGWRTCVINQVHDSIVFDSPRNEVSRVCALAEKTMLNVSYLHLTGSRLQHDIPLMVDVKKGRCF